MDAGTSDSDHLTVVLEVFYIIVWLAPFDFGISLLHPQGREPLMFLNRDELWKVTSCGGVMEALEWFCNLHTQITQQSVSFLWCKDHSLSNQGHCSCNYGLKAAITCGVVSFRDQGHLKVEFGTLDGKFILGIVSTLLKA